MAPPNIYVANHLKKKVRVTVHMSLKCEEVLEGLQSRTTGIDRCSVKDISIYVDEPPNDC